MLVDPYRAAFQLAGYLAGANVIAAPDRSAEACGVLVGFCDGLGDIVIADDRQRGTELLFINQAAAAVYVGNQRDRIGQ